MKAAIFTILFVGVCVGSITFGIIVKEGNDQKTAVQQIQTTPVKTLVKTTPVNQKTTPITKKTTPVNQKTTPITKNQVNKIAQTDKKSKSPVNIKPVQQLSKPILRDKLVKVKLKTGKNLLGVVKENHFIEKRMFGVYVPVTNKKEKGAGVRLWYVNRSNGFLFLTYNSIKKLKTIRKVDGEKIRQRSLARSANAQKHSRNHKHTHTQKKVQPRGTVSIGRSGSSNSSRSSGGKASAIRNQSIGGRSKGSC